MEKTINPRKERIDLGKSKVLAVFIQDKNRQIVGCKIIQGEMKKGSYLEIFRLNKETKEEDLIGKGKISNLKRGEKNVDKIVNGEECGILFEGSLKIEEGDVLLAYIEQEEKIVRI
jgi:translation initiation factor IF-2